MAKTALGFELANERMITFSYIAGSLIIPLLASILCTLFFFANMCFVTSRKPWRDSVTDRVTILLFRRVGTVHKINSNISRSVMMMSITIIIIIITIIIIKIIIIVMVKRERNA